MDLRRSLKSAFGWAAGIGGGYARELKSHATIVAFHRIDGRVSDDPIGCSPERFDLFCRFFRRNFRVLSLTQLLSDCNAGRNVGGTLAITLDDGYADNASVAAPILRKHGLPATFFVTTGWIGTEVLAPWDRDMPVRFPWMNWDDLRGLVAQGFEIGSHTHTHIDMGTADAATIRQELDTSVDTLRRELGIRSRLFAYPFGDPVNMNDSSRNLVREAGFDCCLSCYGGINTAAPDASQLVRIPIGAWCRSPGQFGFELLQVARRGRSVSAPTRAAA